jgi:putative peptide zinc metalloprotease protein
VTLAIAGVSTLLFNANPLQRLDGYFIATDLLDLPNLASRSAAWWHDVLQRRLLRLPGVEPMAVARGESAWLAVYSPLAWLNGIGVAALAVAWLGHLSLALGLLAGALLSWQMIVQPVWRLGRHLRRAALAREGSLQRWRCLGFGALALVLLVLAVPLPQRLLVAGVVWPADDAQLRADESGFVAEVVAGDGATVAAGDLVLRLANPGLETRLERQRARVEAIETELFNALPSAAAADGSALGNRRAELVAALAELDSLVERVAALEMRARVAGRVALHQAADLSGQFVQRGHLLGQVLGAEAGRVRVAMLESDASDLQLTPRKASVRLASAHTSGQRGILVRDGGGATQRLPSAALSTRHGGDIATDPADDLKALRPVVLLDLRLDGASADGRERLGERAWVRLDNGFAPLALQAARELQRQVMQRFNPQF